MDTMLRPSHTVALALVIIMREKSCEAGVASSRLRAKAAHRGLSVAEMAVGIVAAGTSWESAPTFPDAA